MIQTKRKTIDGHEITVTTHPGRRLNQLKVRLIKLLGLTILKALASLFDSTKDAGIQGKKISTTVRKAAARFIENDIRLTEIAQAFESLEERLDPLEYESLIMEIFAFTNVQNGKKSIALSDPQAFDDIFSGNMLLMYKIIAYVIEVNFTDFFALAATSFMKEAAEETQKSQTK